MPETPASNPPSDPGLETNAEPTPVFRRFPWVQLVFCLACLTMAGWTWMRFSYCHGYHIDDLAPFLGTNWRGWPQNTYVHIAGGQANHFEEIPHWRATHCWLSVTQDGEHVASVRGSPSTMERMRSEKMFRGRLYLSNLWGQGRLEGELAPVGFDLRVDASRFTGASIAGLVVGAMGCFIFGMYLLRWLRERKALARQPWRDMIA